MYSDVRSKLNSTPQLKEPVARAPIQRVSDGGDLIQFFSGQSCFFSTCWNDLITLKSLHRKVIRGLIVKKPNGHTTELKMQDPGISH